MSAMRALEVVSQKTGKVLGTITMNGDETVETTRLGQDILDSAQLKLNLNAAGAFAALADGGWSNGYVTVRAAAA